LGDPVLLARLTFGAGVDGCVENEIDICQAEAGKLDIEVEVDQSLKLDREQLLVPASVQRKLIVRDDVGPSLRFREVREPQHRHSLHTEQPCYRYPPMAGDDLIIVPDQHRVGKAEPRDRVRDLPNLFFRTLLEPPQGFVLQSS
jgi:hypothetical protein